MDDVSEFRLPDVGEGLTEADIVRWHVRQGDPVAVNQPIVEIETAKAIVELPSPFGGEVHELLVAEGQTVAVGDAIISVRAAGGPVRQPVLVGYGPGGAPSARKSRGGRPRATPPVRKLARDLRLDLAGVYGTGPNGSITRDDLRRAQAGSAGGGSEPVPETGTDPGPETGTDPGPETGTESRSETGTEPGPGSGAERIPVQGVLKRMAAAMTASAFTAPHVTEFLDVDVTATVDVVRLLREQQEFAGVKVTPTLLAARALVIAAQRNPRINATWSDTEIIIGPDINLGIAVATEDGLIVPNIKRAQSQTLAGLARRIDTLTTAARARATSPADLTGGTITLTNVGVFGVDAGTPILMPGEAAILAVGAIRERPWVHEGALAIRQVVTLALSFDHRLIDGELGARALRDVAAVLTSPLLLIARA
jgi:2-oxoisovalerate dehydrogenase E2 component (dihydrolipoyl transacylase)